MSVFVSMDVYVVPMRQLIIISALLGVYSFANVRLPVCLCAFVSGRICMIVYYVSGCSWRFVHVCVYRYVLVYKYCYVYKLKYNII